MTLSLCACASVRTKTADPSATAETRVLNQNLRIAARHHVMFGHQDDLAYGVQWKYETGRSDVKETSGDYPAVYGWDLGGLEKDSPLNLDGIPFEKMRRYIQDGHARGGVITISWHADNPLTGQNAWDTTKGSLASVLPGGAAHVKFVSWLDAAADFLLTLKDKDGRHIPILFRPYHELTGNWFWWCRHDGTADDFKALWRMTYDHMRKRGVHHLLYVYNTADFASEAEFLERYPGSQYVDMISFDQYQYGDNASFIAKMQKQLAIMDGVAKAENKPMAVAETGYEQVPDANWWTGTLAEALGTYPLSFVLVWRNHGWNPHLDPPRMHYYAPYAGHPSQADFKAFRALDRIWFERDAAAARLYQKH